MNLSYNYVVFAERTRVIISAAVDVDIPEFGADSAEYQTLLWNDSTTLQRRRHEFKWPGMPS